MSTYAIGDIQGCFHSFQHLLERIRFNPQSDRLWLVGDLINRGAGSLEMLRWAYTHRDLIKLVLGNHDLHAITVAEGFAKAHRGDTLQGILDAPDKEILLSWLRHQPLAYAEGDFLMVHAGLAPDWTASKTLSLAAEVEAVLHSTHYRDFLAQMYGNQPAMWQDELQGIDRIRVITNVLTRMRVCTQAGEMEFKFKGELANIAQGYMPWFDVPGRQSVGTTVIFGHWSALGLQQRENLYALDTGCLWGGQLTALRLEDKRIFQVPSDGRDMPAASSQTG